MLSCLEDFFKCLSGCRCRGKAIFSTIKGEGIEVQGNIKMVKLEFNQFIDVSVSFVDRRGNPAKIQAGTAQWSLAATDADGNPVDGALLLEVDANDETKAKVSSASTEATGLLTFRADGDPDADEVVDVVGTMSIVVDAPNVAAVELSNTEPADIPPATP